jgi:NADH:ubiquinone oxidoreductase subunit 2 (subunit N)
MLPIYPTQGVETVKSLTNSFPNLPAVNAHTFVLLLLETLASTSPDQPENIIQVIFSIFSIFSAVLVADRPSAIAGVKAPDPTANRPFYSTLVETVITIFLAAEVDQKDIFLLLEILEVCHRVRV